MKRLRDIKLMIEIAQQGWFEIEGEMQGSVLPFKAVSLKKEKLKNLLEDIRKSIESLMMYSRCNILMKVCKSFLEKILRISESLGNSYAFPGYSESFYILDTMKMADRSDD